MKRRRLSPPELWALALQADEAVVAIFWSGLELSFVRIDNHDSTGGSQDNVVHLFHRIADDVPGLSIYLDHLVVCILRNILSSPFLERTSNPRA